MIDFNTFLYGENYPIVRWQEKDKIDFWIEQKLDYCLCPSCGTKCFDIHDIHSRKIQDTPIHNKNVYIHINVREFICQNRKCLQKTFTEDLSFAGKYQVRTYALTEFILIHAIYMSSNSTSLMLSLLGINVSADTVDNILKSVHIEDNPDVEMIGIDDVALRKGINYATAIYDLETHHLIALLEGREKEDIIPRLKEHKKIKVVARDRASSYAEAINEMFPDATQIADRFHLFQNLMTYLKDKFYSEIPDKIVIKENKILNKKAKKIAKELTNIDRKRLEKISYDNTPPIDENGNIINFIDLQYNLNDELYKKQAQNRIKKYETIVAMRNEKKLSIDELKNKYKFSELTIKKYLKMTNDEVEKIKLKRNNKRNKITEFSKFKNIVYKMLKDKQPYEYIIAYVLKLGYSGPLTTLKGDIYKIANNNGFMDIMFNKFNKYEYSKDETIITRRDLLKYLLTIDNDKKKNKDIEDNFNTIIEKYPIAKEIKTIFEDFHKTIFSGQPELLDDFIVSYKDIIPSFCKGLKKDIAAVKNAISNSINSGFVEGNNNKFKLIKRIVYGKQKLVNLFKRCYLAFTSTLEDLSLLESVISSLTT